MSLHPTIFFNEEGKIVLNIAANVFFPIFYS